MIDPMLEAWLAVIARDGWTAARIDAVAVAADRSTGDVAAVLPDRWAALMAFGRHLDVAALGDAGEDPAGSVRDRLFGIVMARFDAAQDNRPAVIELAAAARRDPGLAAFLALHLPQSIARVAEAAGVATGGLLGPLRVQVLTLGYLAVARVWLGDTTDDLAATMKELDSRLTQAETWARRLPHPAAAMPPVSPAHAATLRLTADLPAE